MFTVTIGDHSAVPVEAGTLLSDALARAGARFGMPCGGRGTCGKCVVWVSGAVQEADAREADHLGRLACEEPPAAGFVRRLACLCRVAGDVRVHIPEMAVRILAAGEGELPAYDGTEKDILGFAVDVGTTTIAMRLYSLTDGALLASSCALNGQGAYGADVLSRIAYADKHGHSAVHEGTIAQLGQMMREALAQAGAEADRVRRVVVTGNTTMLHFLAGLDPHGIGIYPFTPESLFGETLSARELFPFLPEAAEVYLPRCISAYVGADVVCGLLAGGFGAGGEPRLLIDVGTNGEMVLETGGELRCCATAAGPAFEGAQIFMGMTASDGAISRVAWEDGEIVYETVGGVPAKGICGTGLIGAVRAMLACGALDMTGAMNGEDNDVFRIADSGVVLTGKDIREVQLAKAAIAAGVDTLLDSAGLSPGGVGEVLLAGGFGSAIDPADAMGIGLIPADFDGHVRAVGNVALSGAAAMMMSHEARRAAEKLALRTREVPLSTSAVFMDRYMEQMMFPEGK